MFRIVVEDGSGNLEANSFASVEEADGVIEVESDERASAWSALNEEAKAKLLVRSTSFLCDRVRLKSPPVLDVTCEPISALPFPCEPIERASGGYIRLPEIRRRLVRATALAALWFLTEDPDTNDDGYSIKNVRIEPMEIEFRDNVRTAPVPDDVMYALSEIAGIRSKSPRFAPIVRS